jgi:hypothetical protein
MANKFVCAVQQSGAGGFREVADMQGAGKKR